MLHRCCKLTLACLLAGLALVISAAPAAAQIVAPAGRTLFNRGVLVRSVVRYDAFQEAEPSGDLERWRWTNAVVWGARPHMTLSFVTPLTRVQPASGVSRSGAGDSAVFARYDLYRRNTRDGTTRLAPELGIKLPTGGAFGNGATDYSAGLVFSHIRDPDWWVTDVQLTKRGDDGDVRAGDRSRFDLAYLRRIHPRGGVGIPMALAVAELTVEHSARARRHGSVLGNTGGTIVWFSPGIEWLVSRSLVLELAMPIAVVTDLNGRQPEPTWSGLLGMRWLF